MITISCPFEGPHDFEPDDPCPICGDLGTFPPSEDDVESKCIEYQSKLENLK